jgi:hypothetical protein
VALAYAWAAAGSVLEALIVTVFEAGSPAALMDTGTDWKRRGTWARACASIVALSASTAI